jgi:5-formyltetrahydrofolate cyclo-ligase
LPSAERQGAALSVARRVADWAIYGAAMRIAGYWACDGELDPMPLLESAWAASKDVYLPVLVDAPPKSLQFAPYRPGLPLRRNRFDIPEPDVPPSKWLQPAWLDLVLTPVVVFDSTGTRLGMGGGFYDRSFAFLRDLDYRGQRPLLLGLGYEFQKASEHLVRQSWDVSLDAVATEEALYVFAQPNAAEWS